jgi:hypothetical protein
MISDRRTDESLQEYAIRRAWQLGHFWNPANPDGLNVKQSDLKHLSIQDKVVIDAFRSLALSDVSSYAKHVFEKHGRAPQFSGNYGPAMEALVLESGQRCPVPDFLPPQGVVFAFDDPELQKVVEHMQANAVQMATGNGNWEGCHNIGNAHCAIVQVNPGNMPSFLSPLFKTVITRVQKSYADIGLLLRYVDMSKIDILTGEKLDTGVNLDFSFSTSSSGWIGLAQVSSNESCSGRLFQKFLSTYRGGNSDDAVITQWTTLIRHETGHNCGFLHTNSGVMSPTIVNNLPPEWSATDPTTPKLKAAFSGVPVPIPGSPGPAPGPGPQPPVDPVQAQIDALRLKNVIQDVQLEWLIKQVRK